MQSMKKRLIGSLVAATIYISSMAQSTAHSGVISPYSQYGLGILGDQAPAALRGMAGTGIALRSGTQVNTLNPASYSAIDSLTMLFDVGATGQLSHFEEGNAKVNGRSADFDYAVGLFRMFPHVGVSFGLLPFSDIGYNYSTTMRLSNATGNIIESYTGSGGLHQAFVGVGWRPLKPISIGVNAAYLWGSYNRSVSSTATSTVNSLSKSYKATVSSYNITFGVQGQTNVGRNNVLTLGATLGLGHKLGADPTCEIVNVNTSTVVSDTTSFVVDNGLELPLTYGFGLSWNHAQKLTVAADYVMQQWGKVQFPAYEQTTNNYVLRDGLLSNRSRFSVGADFVPNASSVRSYFSRVHYRLGAAFATPYVKINGADGPKELTVSAGLGLPLQNQWNSRASLRPVLNVSMQYVHTSAQDLITDHSFRISLGLTFNERWFAKWRVD